MIPGSIGFQEIIVILIVAVVLFGRRLPSVARSVGQSYQQLRKGLSELQSSIKVDDDEPNYSSDTYSNGLPDYSDSYVDDDGPDFTPPALTSDEETSANPSPSES